MISHHGAGVVVLVCFYDDFAPTSNEMIPRGATTPSQLVAVVVVVATATVLE